MFLEKLISSLADGEFHSGEQLGRLLGISRAAVWKQLQKLTALGLVLERVKGKGYRLATPIYLLDKALINAALQQPLPNSSLSIEQVVDSTNSVILQRINQQSLANGYCVIAEMQTLGRGRRGRVWQSPFGTNIYLSCYWKFDHGMSALDGLSLVIGLCVVNALNKCFPADYALKWPNDVLYQQQKLAGILLELVGDPTGVCHVVIGVGINVNLLSAQLSNVDQAWTSLQQIAGVPFDRNTIAAELIQQLMLYLPQFQAHGFAKFTDEWQKFDAYKGKQVFVQLGDNCIYGIADGVSRNGELRLNTEIGIQLFNGGEVSLRKAYDFSD